MIASIMSILYFYYLKYTDLLLTYFFLRSIKIFMGDRCCSKDFSKRIIQLYFYGKRIMIEGIVKKLLLSDILLHNQTPSTIHLSLKFSYKIHKNQMINRSFFCRILQNLWVHLSMTSNQKLRSHVIFQDP